MGSMEKRHFFPIFLPSKSESKNKKPATGKTKPCLSMIISKQAKNRRLKNMERSFRNTAYVFELFISAVFWAYKHILPDNIISV